MLKAYLKYKIKSLNSHGIHSPFVFEFYNEVIKKSGHTEDRSIQALRSSLLKDKTEVQVTDLGSGSKKNQSATRRISEIAKNAGISRKYGRLLARIIQFYSLESVLELGTSLGLGTAYLSISEKCKVDTIEGCPNVSNQARKNLEGLKRTNVNSIEGAFDDVIPDLLANRSKIDLIFIDGNHNYEATLKYFNLFMTKAHNNTFLVFDDINWSEGMRKAWDEIIASPEIHVSLEFFRMGIVLKRAEQEKQHFVLKF